MSTRITDLPQAETLNGSEIMPLVQNGVTKKATLDFINLAAPAALILQQTQQVYQDTVGVKTETEVVLAQTVGVKDEAQASLAEFDAKYLGPYPSPPSLDPMGNPLAEGAMYWNTDLNAMFVWDGGDWVAFSSAVASVNGQIGEVILTKSDVGLASVTDDAQLKILSNLSDLDNVASARTNLGLGTAAQADVGPGPIDVVGGNDSRLTDAREWTASTVTQAEAEAGTATTRRAWTAQRVRQAISAWWNGILGNPITLSVNSSSDALRITQTGAGNALVVEDSTSPDSTPFVIDAEGKVIVGTTAAQTFGFGSQSPGLQVHGTTGTRIGAMRWTNDSSGTIIHLAKSRGASVGVQAAVQVFDQLGLVAFDGSNGTDVVSGAYIHGICVGTPGASGVPSGLIFSTSSSGSQTPSERMRINADGRVGIGNTGAGGASVSVGGATPASSGFSIGLSYQGSFDPVNTTTAAYPFLSSPSVSAGGTIPNLRHFHAQQGTFTGSVSDQKAFEASNSLIGATNNYGFFSNIPSGTGRWNFYAAGTAANYFNGDVKIGSPSLVGKLGVEGTTAINAPPSLWSGGDGVIATGTSHRSGLFGSMGAFRAGWFCNGYRNTDGTWTSLAINGATGAAAIEQSPNGEICFYADATKENGSSILPTRRMRITDQRVDIESGAGFNINRVSVTSPVASDGNVFSGTYTPTLTNTLNISSSYAYASQYMRVGTTVTVSGCVDIAPGAANTTTLLRISVPIATGFTTTLEARGVSCISDGAASEISFGNGSIYSVGSTSVVELRCAPNATSTRRHSFQFTYRVL